MNWLKLVETIAPFVLRVIPGFPGSLIPVIVQAIQVAEQVPGALGPEKKAIVMDTIVACPASDKTSGITLSNGVDAVVAAANAVRAQTLADSKDAACAKVPIISTPEDRQSAR